MSARSIKRAHARRVARERRRPTNVRRRALVAGATLGASAAFASTAQATTYTVTNSNDSGSGSLREAITSANTTPGTNDTINFAPGLTSPIKLTSGELPITDPNGLTINGPGQGALAIDAQTASRIFNITAPKGTPVTIAGLTLENGSSTTGGAIDNKSGSGPGAATLTLTDSTISGSAASNGGGIRSYGPLTVTRSTITGNTVSQQGGGIEELSSGVTKYDLSITDSTVSDNIAQNGDGGGVFGRANVSISGSQITGNQALTPSPNNYLGFGGGIASESGSLSLANTTVSGNKSTTNGGGVHSNTKYGTTITSSTITGNTSAAGGGLELAQTPSSYNANNPISVKNSTISGNQAANGAGIEIAPSGSSNPTNRMPNPVTIQASTISGNNGGASSFGGGLLIAGTQFDPIELIDSTISGNSATNGGGVSLGNGGATPLLGQSGNSQGSITFDNSTIAANTADTAGGGIYLSQYSAGSPASEQSGTASINSTIVARNTAAGQGQDLFRPPTSTSGGFNTAFSLIQNPGNAPLLSSQALIKGVDPQLGPLANNGGPTQTMMPAFTSPAIDQGKAASGLTTDQRGDARTVDNGKPRPSGGDATDIGAVEVAKIPLVATIAPATGINSSQATLNGKLTTNGEAVTWHFEYGKTTGYGQTTPSQSISAGNGDVPVSFQVANLAKHTLYHYRLVAVNAAGVSATSADAMFTTLAPTINVHPGTVRSGHEVRVFGRAGGCPTGDQVTLISSAFSHQRDFAGKPAIFAKVQSNDRYSVLTTIPKGRAGGRYAITGRCGGGNFGVTAYLRVVHPAARAKAVHVKRKPTFTG